MAPQFLSLETQILSLLDDDVPSLFLLIFDQRSAKGLLSVQFHTQYSPRLVSLSSHDTELLP